MNVVLAADLHISDRPLARLNVGISLLSDCWHVAQQHNTRVIYILGDLLDQKHGVNQRVMLALWRKLKALQFEGAQFVWLRGNHEVSSTSRPEECLMPLFSQVCMPVTDVRMITCGSAWIGLLPWYPPEKFIALAAKIGKATRFRDTGSWPRAYLFTHVGVREGRVSASNIQIPSKVSVKHLMPANYDLVLMGDYHAHQKVADNVQYLGAPIQHMHGDHSTKGLWVLDLETACLQAVGMPRVYPEYTTLDFSRVDNPEDVEIPSYDEANHYKLRVPYALVAAVSRKFPKVEVESIAGEVPKATEGRLEGVDTRDVVGVFKEFLKSRGLNEGDHFSLGMSYLRKAGKA